MARYESFLIAPFQEGMDKQFEPFLTPDKAFSQLTNVYLNRGIVKKRMGSSVYGQLGTFVDDEHVGALGTKNYTGTLSNIPAIVGSVLFYDSGGATQSITDDGDGTLSGDGTGTIVYSTGVYDVTFTANTVADPDVDYHYSDTSADRMTRGIYIYDKSDGTSKLLAFDKRRGSAWNTSYEYFENVGSGTAVTSEAFTVAGKTVSAITKAADAQVTTTTSHGYSTADVITIYGSNATEANGNAYTITKVDATKFTLGVDSSAWTAPGTSGTSYRQGDTVTDTTANIPVIPSTVTIVDSDSGQEAYDDGNGILSGDVSGSSNTINYTTGVMSLVFKNPVTSSTVVNYNHFATPVYNIWNNVNLIWGVNYWDKLWLCDNSAHVFTFDGTYFVDEQSTLNYNSSDHTVDAALMIFTFFDRMILLNTLENGTRHGNRARWSAVGNPDSPVAWKEDQAGKGGYVDAPTNDEIVSAVQLKDMIIVYMESSTWKIVYTGNPDLPIRWIRLNSRYECDSTFGSWGLDEFAVATGKFDLVGSDGVSVQQFNQKLPEFSLEIDYEHIGKCFGYLYNDKDQAWLSYPSSIEERGYPDTVLVYNFRDTSFSEYSFLDDGGGVMQVRCLGEYDQVSDVSFTDMENGKYWDDIGTGAEFEDYKAYQFIEVAKNYGDLIYLAGSQYGFIYQIDGIDNDDNDYNYNFEILTKRYNPYLDQGFEAYLGYVDFLVSTFKDQIIIVDFYVDNDNDPVETLTQRFECNNTGKALKVWKRVYCGASGETIRFRLSSPTSNETEDQPINMPFELHAMRLYMKPGGRLI